VYRTLSGLELHGQHAWAVVMLLSWCHAVYGLPVAIGMFYTPLAAAFMTSMVAHFPLTPATVLYVVCAAVLV
jgi:hypothetical protein